MPLKSAEAVDRCFLCELSASTRSLAVVAASASSASPRDGSADEQAGKPDELAIKSRSIMQMMSVLATFVDVPQEDIDAGAATPAPDVKRWKKPVLQVFSGKAPPRNAFVAVKYQGHWFWIDNRD